MTKNTKKCFENKLDALTYYEKGLGYDQADYDEKNKKKLCVVIERLLSWDVLPLNASLGKPMIGEMELKKISQRLQNTFVWQRNKVTHLHSFFLVSVMILAKASNKTKQRQRSVISKPQNREMIVP